MDTREVEGREADALFQATRDLAQAVTELRATLTDVLTRLSARLEILEAIERDRVHAP